MIYRLPLLKARHELDSWMSKEAAFLANNWILTCQGHCFGAEVEITYDVV